MKIYKNKKQPLKVNTFLLLLCFLGLAIIWQSCKKDCKKKCQDASNPDCENYDPCYSIKPANADFGIFNPTPLSGSVVDTSGLTLSVLRYWKQKSIANCVVSTVVSKS